MMTQSGHTWRTRLRVDLIAATADSEVINTGLLPSSAGRERAMGGNETSAPPETYRKVMTPGPGVGGQNPDGGLSGLGAYVHEG